MTSRCEGTSTASRFLQLLHDLVDTEAGWPLPLNVWIRLDRSGRAVKFVAMLVTSRWQTTEQIERLLNLHCTVAQTAAQ